MPVIRELVNRISFKINPADKKNAQAAMDKMDKRADQIITKIGKIGKAFTAAVGLMTVKGIADLKEFETKTATLDFFSTTEEQANRIRSIFDDLAARSDIISRSNARFGASVLAQTGATAQQIKELSPFIEQLTQARPDIGFTGIIEAFQSFIGGDLDALKQLIPGIKNTAELLKKANFQQAFAGTTQEGRVPILLEQLLGNEARIKELAAKQKDTITNEIRKISETASDFSLKFGENTAKPLKETIALVDTMLDRLLQSESFWTTVQSAAEGLASLFERISEIQEKGLFGFIVEKQKEAIKEQAKVGCEQFESDVETVKSGVSTFLNFLGNAFSPTKPGQTVTDLTANRNLPNLGPVGNGQTLTVNVGDIRITGEGGGMLTQTGVEQIVKDVFTQVANNITAQNGGYVTAQ